MIGLNETKKAIGEPCSPELKACVDALIADGKPEDSAWAICRSKVGEATSNFQQELEDIEHQIKSLSDKLYKTTEDPESKVKLDILYARKDAILQKIKAQEATKNPDNPNKPREPALPMPDDNNQCPPGTRWSGEQGGCVPTTTCPEGQHWSDAQGGCVAIPKSIPEGTEVLMGTPAAPDTSHTPLIEGDLASERVARLKAEDKRRHAELDLANWQVWYKTLSNENLSLNGKYTEAKTTIERLEKQITGLNSTRATDESTIKDFKRRLEDMTASRDDYKKALEDLKTKHEALDLKYKEQLKTNLGLSKKLTEDNEDYLKIAKEKEETEEKLKKARRLGKITYKL